jgi:hypothetical protein
MQSVLRSNVTIQSFGSSSDDLKLSKRRADDAVNDTADIERPTKKAKLDESQAATPLTSNAETKQNMVGVARPDVVRNEASEFAPSTTTASGKDVTASLAQQPRPLSAPLLALSSVETNPSIITRGVNSSLGSASHLKPILVRDPIYFSKMPRGNLIPIRIRLSAFGVRIHDDFYIDPALTETCPLEIAQSLAKDLNLNDDLTVALTIHIAEQMHGLTPVEQPMDPTYDLEQGAAVSTEKRQMTAAFKLGHRVYIANVAHLVQDYKT